MRRSRSFKKGEEALKDDSALSPPSSPSSERGSGDEMPKSPRKGKEKKFKRSKSKLAMDEALKASESDSTVIKAGFLEMKIATKKSFKKRWIIITPHLAQAFDRPIPPQQAQPPPASPNPHLKFTLDLSTKFCRVVLRSNPAVFGIASESFEWDFKVSDKSILAAWMAAFEKGIGGGAGEEEGERGSRVSVSVPRGSGSGIKEGKKEEEEGELKREGGGGKYQKMLEALTKEGEGGRRMRECLVESLEKKEQKEVGEMLVHACEALGAGVAGRVLGELVRIEIERCNKPNTLFRGNNFAEKALTSYCVIVGSKYLGTALKPLFMSVTHSEMDYEIDPSKAQQGADMSANTANLLSIVEMFLAKITRSKFTNVPYPLRTLCRDLAEATKTKYPESVYFVVGGLFFLRFVCPALTLPKESGVWDGEIQPETKRTLLLITKTLMNLSNGVLFGKKEEYMVPMNPFLTSHQQPLRSFFDTLLLTPEEQDPEQQQEENRVKREYFGTPFPQNDKLLQSFVFKLKEIYPRWRRKLGDGEGVAEVEELEKELDKLWFN